MTQLTNLASFNALKEKLETQEDSSNKQVTNIDLLKRISNLEKIVYGRNE